MKLTIEITPSEWRAIETLVDLWGGRWSPADIVHSLFLTGLELLSSPDSKLKFYAKLTEQEMTEIIGRIAMSAREKGAGGLLEV